jgi:two-component system, cell cycle sensor histidine kinase and response regulator CckA
MENHCSKDNLADSARKPTSGPTVAGKAYGLVLVVDDHPAVLEAMRILLESKGYNVLLAASGFEAVQVCRQHKGDITTVLTDMMMPKMDGVATVRALREIDSNLKFIGISGIVDSGQIKELDSLKLTAFLQKPFAMEELVQTLQKAAPGADMPQSS